MSRVRTLRHSSHAAARRACTRWTTRAAPRRPHLADHTPINEQSAEGGDTLHGGNVGFDRRTWTVAASNRSSVTFTLAVADGEQGFPGPLAVTVTHALGDDNVWRITYAATTTAPVTVVSMTNHACA